MATFSEDGAARLWDPETGEPLTPSFQHPAGLSSGCLLAEGKYLFGQCSSELVAIWELPRDARPVEDWVALASLLAARRFNSAGFLELLGTASLSEDWKVLRAKYAEEFRPAHGFAGLKASPGTTLPPSPIRPVPVQPGN